MVVQAGAAEQGDGAFGIPQAQAQGGVHVIGAGQALVQTSQRRVVVGPHQAVQDAAGKVVADSDFQAGRGEGCSCGL
ncbi:hypothetical protein G6F35_018906 [Rhizopus arrhizus]|nr:hypothetical protein G6F35_018906 [Rhizopus arrhizus]